MQRQPEPELLQIEAALKAPGRQGVKAVRCVAWHGGHLQRCFLSMP